MLHFKKLMLNSTKIEDVVEVRIELGKTFVREKFVFLGDSFFLFNQRSGGVGVEINDNSVSREVVGVLVGGFN